MPTLRPRTNTFNAAFRVRSAAAYAIHKFFQENGFIYSHSPLLTASDCEGAGEMFQVTTLDLQNVPKNEDGTVDYSCLLYTSGGAVQLAGRVDHAVQQEPDHNHAAGKHTAQQEANEQVLCHRGGSAAAQCGLLRTLPSTCLLYTSRCV